MSDLAERSSNRLISHSGQFTGPVRVEIAVEIASGVYLLRVRRATRYLDDAQPTVAELEQALVNPGEEVRLVDLQDRSRR